MATGGEVPGHKPSSGWAEDLDNIKCQPCLEDGHLHEAVGICVDCDDYLCSKCFEGHKLPRPCRNHQLLDREQMKTSEIRASMRDACTDKCSVHEDEITKYYCTKHHLLGCTVCITLGGHSTCENVRYIPHVAKELTSNEEYQKAEKQLNSALETFNRVCENVERNLEELEVSSAEAIKSIKKFRKCGDIALDKIETELIEKVQKLKTEEMKKLDVIRYKYKANQDELKSRITRIDAFRNAKQNCSLYTEMMRTGEKLSAVQSDIKEAAVDASYRKCQVIFCPNKDLLKTLKLTESFGNVQIQRQARGKIVKARHMKDLKVNTKSDKTTCAITGSVILNDTNLVLADYLNKSTKSFDTHSNNLLTELKLSSGPWDIATISSNKVALTLPMEHKVIIVTMGNTRMNMDTTLCVGGTCRGINYKNGMLAVSFKDDPGKVKIFNLRGATLNEIANDKIGNNIFNSPQYLAFGQDENILYVSSRNKNNVKCLKLDGTVKATYTDSELYESLQPWVDSSGDVLVCSRDSNSIHQITSDCKKVRILLSKTDGLTAPYSISYSEKDDTIVVGMDQNNTVKIYKLERDTKYDS